MVEGGGGGGVVEEVTGRKWARELRRREGIARKVQVEEVRLCPEKLTTFEPAIMQ